MSRQPQPSQPSCSGHVPKHRSFWKSLPPCLPALLPRCRSGFPRSQPLNVDLPLELCSGSSPESLCPPQTPIPPQHHKAQTVFGTQALSPLCFWKPWMTPGQSTHAGPVPCSKPFSSPFSTLACGPPSPLASPGPLAAPCSLGTDGQPSVRHRAGLGFRCLTKMPVLGGSGEQEEACHLSAGGVR